MRKLITICCLALAAAVAMAQQQGSPPNGGVAAASSTRSGSLTPSSLHTDNLNYGDDIKRIYVGDFDHVSFQRDSTNFSLLVSGYMTEYSKSCDRYLPKDKVQIMKTVCSNQVATVNQYGQEVDARRCTQYETVGTGRYADPRVYALQKTLDSAQTGAIARAYVQDITQKDGGAPGLRQMADIGTYVLQDSSQFLVDNECSAAATMRYQENMLHFGRNEAPVRMPGAAEAMRPPVLARQQNYKGLVDDLITEESKAWAANRYQTGSAHVVAVQREGDGSPKEIDAGYTVATPGNQAAGKVRVTIGQDEQPCLYFSDAPTTCRIPNPKVVAAFRHNKYADQTAPEYPAIPPWDDAPGAVDARRRAFEKVQADVAAANARRAAGTSPTRPGVPTRPASPGSPASAVVPGTPFRLTAHTLDPINETNVGSGAVFRASVDRTQGLSNGQVPVGAVVYLKVELEQQSAGGRASNDVYSILLDKVEVEGKTFPLPSKSVRLVRRANVASPANPQADYSAINAGTVLNFFGTQP
jgi:hypothetical protein